MKINILHRSHSFWVDCGNSIVKQAVWGFLPTVTSKKEETNPYTREKRLVNDKTFAVRSPCGRYVGLTKGIYDEFKAQINMLTSNTAIYVEEFDVLSPATKVTLKLKKGVSPKDKQKPAITHLEKDLFQHVLHCATGFGKTFLGLYWASQLGVRTAFIMNAGHIKTWLEDASKFLDIDKKDIVVIRGAHSIRSLLVLQERGELKAKLIFMSSQTLREYIKLYEAAKDDDFEYSVSPMDMWEYLGIGNVVRDEAHEALSELARQNIYVNVKHMMLLTATIVSEDKFVNRMYSYIFPRNTIWESEKNKHIVVTNLRYWQSPSLTLKHSGAFGYSHLKYEESILKRVRVTKQYMNLFELAVQYYKEDYEEGKKALFFCSTVAMCKVVCAYLAPLLPNLKVSVYVSATPDSVIKESDVLISTSGSFGTGKNVVNLSHSFNTINVNSKKLAWQMLGRLRELVNYPGQDPKYYFFSNMTIPSHRKVSATRMIDLRDKTKSMKVVNLDFTLQP